MAHCPRSNSSREGNTIGLGSKNAYNEQYKAAIGQRLQPLGLHVRFQQTERVNVTLLDGTF
jgi:hypothetical protein